jgi:hypothetical protein
MQPGGCVCCFYLNASRHELLSVRWIRRQNVTTSAAREKQSPGDRLGQNKLRKNFFQRARLQVVSCPPLRCGIHRSRRLNEFLRGAPKRDAPNVSTAARPGAEALVAVVHKAEIRLPKSHAESFRRLFLRTSAFASRPCCVCPGRPRDCATSPCCDETRATVACRRRASRKNEKPAEPAGLRQALPIMKSGAGEGIRTLDPDLGKVVLYH